MIRYLPLNGLFCVSCRPSSLCRVRQHIQDHEPKEDRFLLAIPTWMQEWTERVRYHKTSECYQTIRLKQQRKKIAVEEVTSRLIYHLLSVFRWGRESELMRPYSNPLVTLILFKVESTSSTRTNASSSVFITYFAETTCVYWSIEESILIKGTLVSNFWLRQNHDYLVFFKKMRRKTDPKNANS